jgi:hypothetical protein
MQARFYQPASKTVLPRLISLITTLKTCLLPAELAKIVIFGSASIVLNGVALGREAKDLDVFVLKQLSTRWLSVFPCNRNRVKQARAFLLYGLPKTSRY